MTLKFSILGVLPGAFILWLVLGLAQCSEAEASLTPQRISAVGQLNFPHSFEKGEGLPSGMITGLQGNWVLQKNLVLGIQLVAFSPVTKTQWSPQLGVGMGARITQNMAWVVGLVGRRFLDHPGDSPVDDTYLLGVGTGPQFGSFGLRAGFSLNPENPEQQYAVFGLQFQHTIWED